jgi:pyruvate/2-oxoglutarate dehydrogenase complex dihydrolipoamide acyltransferase (E2) component
MWFRRYWLPHRTGSRWHTISVLIGGATERPRVVEGEVAVRRILDLSVQIDHRMVDGAPAGRFGATLRELLENPDLVDW